jgi:GTP pyrophosphokinase
MEQMEQRFEKLAEKINTMNPSADINKIRRAFECALEAHDGQLRKNGEPYVIHPIEVADIITDMGLDTDSICAGLLHDCVEDTHVSYNDIKTQFGVQIADLVDGVTRLSRIKYSSKEEEQMEDLRKMFLAMAKDIG